MNLISHFFLDKNRNDRFFFVGVSTPDLVSNFDRTIRLKAARLPILMETDTRENQVQFYNGVLRHFEVDRLFHSSPFFQQETRFLSQELRFTFGNDQIERAYFVAHILLELILDRVLIRRHKDLVQNFYDHFQERDVPELVEYTEWVAQEKMPGYGDFLRQFASKQFLYRYVDLRYLANVLDSILLRVGIEHRSFLRQKAFIDFMKTYENRLSDLYLPAMDAFSEELISMKV